MELIFATKDEIIDFFRNHNGFFSVINIATSVVVPRVHRSTTMDEEWQHVRKVLHELKSDGLLLVEGEGQDIYHEKFSSTPERLGRYLKEKEKNLMLGGNAIKKSVETFLQDTRFDQRKRKFKTISEHFPLLEESDLRTTLSQIGAMRFRDKDGTELWGLPPHKKTNIESGNADDDLKGSIHFAGDYVAGDKIGRDKNRTITPLSNPRRTKLELGISIVLVIIAMISIPWWPAWTQDVAKLPFIHYFSIAEDSSTPDDSLATSTLSVKEILDKNFSLSTTIDKESFLKRFEGSVVHDSGTISDISKPFDGYYLILNVGRYPVACALGNIDAETEQKILLLKIGESVSFSGSFTGTGYGFGGDNNPWLIQDCVVN